MSDIDSFRIGIEIALGLLLVAIPFRVGKRVIRILSGVSSSGE